MGMPRKCQERLTGPGIAVLGPRQQKARLGGMRGDQAEHQEWPAPKFVLKQPGGGK